MISRMIPGNHLAAAALWGLASFGIGGTATAGDVDTMKFETVLEFSSNFWYTEFEKPYFEEVLPKLSDGKLSGNALPFDQLGMSGFEMMKLLKIGTYDFAAGSMGYVTGDNPYLEGIALAGTTRSIEDFRAVREKYFPTFERVFEETFNSKLIALYTYPVSQIICNLPNAGESLSLADLKGKIVRSYSATVSDFFEGIGATAVIMPMGDIPTGLQRGTIDCFSSTPLAAYNGKFHQVATHVLEVPVNYSVGYFAFNLDTWNSLTPEAQQLIETSMKDMANQMIERTPVDEAAAAACLGAGPCKYGEPGNLKVIEPSEQDMATMNEVVQSHILPRWATRCGTADCVGDWNAFVGPVIGIDYKP